MRAEALGRVQLFRDPMECRPPGASVHGISQARMLEWVANPSSRGPSRSRGQARISCISCVAGGFFFLTTQSSGKPLFVEDAES